MIFMDSSLMFYRTVITLGDSVTSFIRISNRMILTGVKTHQHNQLALLHKQCHLT